jgi:serine/threonine-protein kinase
VQSDTITAGLVISQLPAAGAKADQGAQVELTVSSGPQLVKVDSFVGVVATEAKTTLEKLGFTVTINQQVSDQPVGNVIAQTPPAGQVAPKSNIALTVSAGPDQAIIPNVIGFDAVDAGVALAKLSVNVVKATEASATVAVNKVIRTEPAAGTPVPKNTDVKLVVSSGPAPIVVPSVVDMTQSDAVDAIQKVNLKVRLVTIASDTAHIGKVVSQDPAGNGTNTLAQPDGTVVLNVGRGPDTTTTSPPPPSTVAPPTTVASTTTAAAP